MLFHQADLIDLENAKMLLENPGVAVKIANRLGEPIERVLELLPAGLHEKVGEITRTALTRAVNTAVMTLDDAPHKAASTLWHKIGVAATGGAGGFFGLAALAAELPVSTIIMLRSIADIARSEGEDIRSIESRMACIEVFALGGSRPGDDAAEVGYFAVRAMLAQSVTEAIKYISGRGILEEGTPVLMRLIMKIAERFSIQVSQKVVAESVPVIGAAGGAIVNLIFIDHFQDMARGHFTVRRLERKYGADEVRKEYERI
jgi:hypothetical protein